MTQSEKKKKINLDSAWKMAQSEKKIRFRFSMENDTVKKKKQIWIQCGK